MSNLIKDTYHKSKQNNWKTVIIITLDKEQVYGMATSKASSAEKLGMLEIAKSIILDEMTKC